MNVNNDIFTYYITDTSNSININGGASHTHSLTSGNSGSLNQQSQQIGNQYSSGGYGYGTSGNGIYTYPNGITYIPTTTTIGTGAAGTGYYGGYATSTITYTYTYKAMKLPRKEIPRTVYVSGRMVTLGIIGSEAECAYAGEHLIFAPGITETLGNTTIILEYPDEIYNYKVLFETSTVVGSKNKLCVKLLSRIPK